MIASPSEKLPSSFGTSTAFTRLTDLGLLQISGEGAKKLLQGQITCDVEEISATQTRLGAHCNPQGRMLSLFRLFLYQDDYYLQMPREILPAAQAALQKYAVFFKVKLQDASDQLQRISYSGLEAEAQLKTIYADLPAETNHAIVTNNTLIIKLPGTVPHYELIGTSFSEKLAANTYPGGINTWKYLNICAGIPSLYAATAGKLLPHEINLLEVQGVSLAKGCYTGQEIIARMHYRGQLKKHLYRARVNTATPPQPGNDIFHEKACGIIVDSSQESENIWQILMIADQTDVETGQLFLDPAETEAVELLPLPYQV